MPSKHKAGGCNCCGCSCTFSLSGCDYTWNCPDAVRTVFSGACGGSYTVLKDTGSTGTWTVVKDRTYKLDVYCDDESTITHTYNLGVLTTSSGCATGCNPTPLNDCECAESLTTKRSIATCDVTVSGTVATCTSQLPCGGSVSSYNWDGTYTIPCNDGITLYKTTLVQTACANVAGNDVYILESLSISFISDGTTVGVNFTLSASRYVQSPGSPNPCPTPTSSCSVGGSGILFNSCGWTGGDTSQITYRSCTTYDPCGSNEESSKKQCVTSVSGTMTCVPQPPFFVNLCNYSGVTVSVVI